jgi:hypothetical protein
LLEEPERERFDLLLETRHTLKSSRIGGRHLRYGTEVKGEWVALLTGGDCIFGLNGNQSGILERAGLKLSQVFSPSGK